LCLSRFLRTDLGVKPSDWWSSWLDQVKDAHAQSKSRSKLPSLCSTQRHNGALRQTLTYYGQGNLCVLGVEARRLGDFRRSSVQQGVATRNIATTREFLSLLKNTAIE
jgi:hypothetical protein